MSYQPLHEDAKGETTDDDSLNDELRSLGVPRWRQKRMSEWVLFGAALVACCTLSFVLGRWTAPQQCDHRLSSDGRLAPAGEVDTVWQYNYTFAREPTPESEAAWGSLPPVGGAFVRHPRYNQRQNIAMYHQLHCLHGLRIGFYLEAAKSNATLNESMAAVRELWGDHDSAHTIHCFDYLRQALLCAADTNLEPVDDISHHVDAWGTPRKCRNRQVIDSWAYKWRSSNRTGIV